MVSGWVAGRNPEIFFLVAYNDSMEIGNTGTENPFKIYMIYRNYFLIFKTTAEILTRSLANFLLSITR